MKQIKTLFVTFFLAACLLISTQLLAEEDWSQQGISHLKAKRHKEAVDAFSKAIAEVYNNRGVAFHHKGDYDKALEIRPRYADVYNKRGSAWVHKGVLDKAVSDYTQAVEIDPEFDDVYYNRAAAHAEQGSFEEAVSAQNKAIELLKEKGGKQKHLAAYRERLNAYKAHKTWRQTLAKEEYDLTGDFGHEESPAGEQASQKIFPCRGGL